MTGPRSQIEKRRRCADAALHSPLARAVFVTIHGKVYKLLKAMYGLRDAGAAFDRKVLGVTNLRECHWASSASVLLDTGK